MNLDFRLIGQVYIQREQCARLFRKCYGIASLEVGGVREIGLDIEQDTISHANIIKLPYREDNLIMAERLAGLLAKRSPIVWTLE